ncbi:MAG: T9SS type A sorting domain-containing protein [Bacteroidia bacterium]
MNKNLLSVFGAITMLFCVNSAMGQNRYINEVFTDVSKSSNIVYDSNYAINLLFGKGIPGLSTSPIWKENLLCDVYTPSGDTETKRPVIILTHTGSYLPAYINKQTTGNKDDNSIVELANRFAKRGYVVVAMNYRLGWNPATTIQEQATEQLIKATYRGLQDVRNCVRFIRNNASALGVDTSKIVVGGQGTGGYISMALGSVSTRADIESNLKFLRGDASPMVSVDTLGDWTGLGGAVPLNDPADASIPSNVHMTFNYGGAMGDSAWMKTSSLPIVSMHVTRDPFAPYRTGNVIVPTTGITVIPNASGAHDVIRKANTLGINNKLNSYLYLDEYSMRADDVNPDVNNVFGFETAFPFEGSSWEWWDRAAAQAKTSQVYRGVPLPANGREADSLSMLTNPFMSEARGKAYIDTISGYLAPRIAVQLDLTGNLALNNFGLISPASGTSVNVRKDSTNLIVAKWEKATMVEGVDYVWMLDYANGDFSEPLALEPVTGVDSIVFTENDVWENLTALGLGVDQTANLKWTVLAMNSSYGKMANASYNINLTKRAPVGVKEIDYSNFLNVYPNPAVNNIRVSLDVNSSISEISVMDLLGRQISRVDGINSNNFDLSLNGATSGIYIVNVKTSNGATASKKFIVQ